MRSAASPITVTTFGTLSTPKKHRGQLTWTDRLTIEKMLKQGASKTAIARYLGVHHSTIYREIERGMVDLVDYELRPIRVYSPEAAEARHKEKNRNKEQALKIDHDHEMAKWLVHTIGDLHYSPAAACAMMGESEETTFSCSLCRQTVYKYIDKGYLWPLTNKDLRYKGDRKRTYKQVRKASRASAGESIERRPYYIDDRKQAGHWEMDCVESRKGVKRTALVLTERKTRYEKAMLMRSHTAGSVVTELNKLERKLGLDGFRELFKSITVDNGHEFQDVKGLEMSCTRPGEQRTKLYYCHPYSSWERGSNEKQNQMIRWHFPKGTDFRKVSQKEMNNAIAWINNYPRKILEWSTSSDLFYDEFGIAL